MYESIEGPSSETCAKVIRVVNIIAAVILVSFGVVGLVFMAINTLLSTRFFLAFSPIFMILLGLMMVAAEFSIGMLLQNFDFLTTLVGRGLFYIYLSSSVFFYFSCGTSDVVLAWISSMIIFGLGVMYVVLHFCAGEGYAKSLKEQMMIQKPQEQLN